VAWDPIQWTIKWRAKNLFYAMSFKRSRQSTADSSSIGGSRAGNSGGGKPKPKKKRGTTQYRYWMLTINAELHWIPHLPQSVRWLKCQLEKGESTSYFHWQVVVSFPKKVSFKRLREVFGPGIHFEETRSAAANEYVWKEETCVNVAYRYEFGEPAFQRGSVADWSRIVEAAKGNNLSVIPDDIFVRYYGALRRIAADYAVPAAMERTAVVFWGKTGVGKTHRAWQEAGMGAYPKNPRTKWWDGYRGHQHVIIDEFSGAVHITYLLQWLDKYPLFLEVKGSHTPSLIRKIWITSNLDPEKWYRDPIAGTLVNCDSEEQLRALMRRIEVIKFPQD
jgi:hypothetical protein